MALIVEDGSIVEGANTFADVSAANAYWALRGGSWASSEQDEETIGKKENALVRATDYLNTLQWKGKKVEYGHTVCFPRKDVVCKDEIIPEDIVPKQVQQACIEIAAIFFDGTDLFAPLERGGRVQTETVSVISTTYFDDAPEGTLYPVIGGLLSDLLVSVPNENNNRVLHCAKIAR